MVYKRLSYYRTGLVMAGVMMYNKAFLSCVISTHVTYSKDITTDIKHYSSYITPGVVHFPPTRQLFLSTDHEQGNLNTGTVFF